jgi:hypothetical protein
MCRHDGYGTPAVSAIAGQVQPVTGVPRRRPERECSCEGFASRVPLRARRERGHRAGIGRRTDVVGIFPDDRSLFCLVSMLAIEANDEWLVTRCYMTRQSKRRCPSSRRPELPAASPTG